LGGKRHIFAGIVKKVFEFKILSIFHPRGFFLQKRRKEEEDDDIKNWHRTPINA
jgi:hypothetical protein